MIASLRVFVALSIRRMTARAYPWALAALFVALYGLRTTDVEEFRIVATSPLRMLLPENRQFLYSSPFTFFIANYYSHHGVPVHVGFVVVELIGACLFLYALHRVFTATVEPAAYAPALVILFASPLLFVLTSFVGKSDPYLIGFFLLLTIAESAATVLLLALAMTLCHSEMGAAILLAYVFLHRSRWRPIAAGVAVGEILVWSYTHLWLTPVPESRTSFLLLNLAGAWQTFAHHPLLHLFAAFGVFWIFVVTNLTRARFAVVAFALLLAVVARDFTRVFILVSIPLLIDIARGLAVEIARDGGIRVGRYRVGVNAVWPLVFVQLQLAGPTILWARGIDWIVGP
jgi:hypothetical protein